MNVSDLNQAIERGLGFLNRSQLPSGEFKVYRSRDELKDCCEVDSSPFPTALIAYSLGFCDSPAAAEMVDRCLRFFLAEMEGQGLWRYWTKAHPYHSIIPPDLDDIACVSHVLRRHDVSFPSNEKLILANRNEAGLFYTWVTPRWPPPLNVDYCRAAFRQLLNPVALHRFWKVNESAPGDVDCVVNANVLLYLGENDATRGIVKYLLDVVERREEECCDKWHLNRFMFYYVMARNFHAGVSAFESAKATVGERIIAAANADGSFGTNVLDTALAVCALCYWKSSTPQLERAVEFLLREQRSNGDWDRAVLYYGGPKKFFGWGSEELTTGFCLEALAHYRATLA